MNSLYNSWRSFQNNFLQYLSALLLVSLTLLALVEVIRRYILGVSFEWQQDLVTFGILSGIFLFFGGGGCEEKKRKRKEFFFSFIDGKECDSYFLL